MLRLCIDSGLSIYISGPGAMEKWQDLEWVEAQKIVITTDLLTTTKKHLEFLKVVHDNGKLYNGCVLNRAVFRYKYCWLPLLARYSRFKISGLQLVVPLDCEWIWHCHRLNPVRYMDDCKDLFGITLDPCGIVISSVEGSCKKETEKLWNSTYPNEPYELDFDDCLDKDSCDHVPNMSGSLSTKYDLVSAVKRQSSFYYQVSRSFVKNDVFLEEAIKRYKGFLHMIRRNMKTFCVPTYDIDLIWHTHQLSPLSYCNDMMLLLGNVLNHDDTDSNRAKGQKLDNGFSRTTEQWNEMFRSRYWRAGAMYIPPVKGQNRCINISQSYEIMFMEIMVEVIEIRNLSTKYEGNLILSICKKQHDMLFKDNHHLSICSETKETQAVLFQCEPKGVLLFDLLDSSSKNLGTCSISLSEFVWKVSTPTWLKFESDMSVPITLGVVISTTQPCLMKRVDTRSEPNDNEFFIMGIIGSEWTMGGICSGSGGGCGGGGCSGGGGGCRASCGGCRSSCGSARGNCNKK